MSKKQMIKRVCLAGCLALVLLAATGCFSRPDTVDVAPSSPLGELEPFPEITPTPSPPPPGQGTDDWQQFQTDDGQGGGIEPPAVITAAPQPAATVTPTPSPSPTPTPDATLRHGSSGDAVRRLQQRLKDLGYYSGAVDGDFGGGTESALKEFQRVNGLTADGIAGRNTLNRIDASDAKRKPSPTPAPTRDLRYAADKPTPKSYQPSPPDKYRYLQIGSSGQDVTRLQNRLKELGYYSGTVTGTYNDATEAAVRAFQKRNGEWVDGVAGEDTQLALFGTDALPAASGSSAVPPGGYRTLRFGSSGVNVLTLQERLKELGYYNGKVDGQYGEDMQKAVEAFQDANGLAPAAKGNADMRTQILAFAQEVLYAPTTQTAPPDAADTFEALQEGSAGEDVFRLQERLYALGYYTGALDSQYSKQVADAVKAFQRAMKLNANGVVNEKTHGALYGDGALPAEGADDTYQPLRQGDTGERVRAMQSILSTYGYFEGEIDGRYLESTTAAVRHLQRQNGLPVADGVAGPATLRLLYDGAPQEAAISAEEDEEASIPAYRALSRGDSGPDVTMLQEFLTDMGYMIVDEDGEYGASTYLAVQSFQERNALDATGAADEDTLSLLYSGLGVPVEAYYATLEETPERDVMQRGDVGQDVYTLQERLVTLGYLLDTPDGTYGASTASAVRAFQEKNGLTADGVAGRDTVLAMYKTDVLPMDTVLEAVKNYALVDNGVRELQEQALCGAIQSSLSGGGVAASHDSRVYFTGKGGALYRKRSGDDTRLYEGAASCIHASEKGITFLSGNSILRLPLDGGKARTLVKGNGISKMSLLADTLVYLQGDTLMRKSVHEGMEPVVIATGVTDFTVDVFQYDAYLASDSGIRRISLNGTRGSMLLSSPADQVQVADSIVFYLSDGSIYRMENGVSVRVVDMNADWMGVYRDKLFFLSGGGLYACDTDGRNNVLLHEGPVADVSFAAGQVYVTARHGGPVTDILKISP